MRLEIEEDIFVDLPNTCLMSNKGVIGRDTDIRDRIRAREGVKKESITVDFCNCSGSRFFDIKQPSVDGYSTIFRETLRDDLTRCIFSDMDDFGSCIGILPSIGECDTEVKGLRVISLEDRTWIEHRHTRAEISPNPLDRSSCFYDSSFRIEVIGIDRPVLNR